MPVAPCGVSQHALRRAVGLPEADCAIRPTCGDLLPIGTPCYGVKRLGVPLQEGSQGAGGIPGARGGVLTDRGKLSPLRAPGQAAHKCRVSAEDRARGPVCCPQPHGAIAACGGSELLPIGAPGNGKNR